MKKKTRKINKRNMILTASTTAATAATFLIAVPSLAAANSPTKQTEQYAGYHEPLANIASAFSYAEMQRARTQNAVFGVIEKINGSLLTLSHYTRDGMANVTIATSDATMYKTNGVPDANAKLAVGQRIVAMGVKDSVGHITDAASINIFVLRTRV